MSNGLGANCEIVIATTLANAWSEWFDGFELTSQGTTSLLTGTIVDQAALHGILGQLRDLGIPILDVHVRTESAIGYDT